MINRRRLSLQLTPLLDLLLIVMFSQYIENRNRMQAVETERVEGRRAIEEERTTLLGDIQRQKQELTALRQTYDERFQSILTQHQQAGTLLAQSLNLPAAAMTEVLKLRTAGQTDDAARLEAAAATLQKALEQSDSDLFRFALRVDEMQKHVSMWEVHIQDNGKASVSDGHRSATVEFTTVDEFASRIFEATKSFDDPNTLVITLLTWGDAQGGPRQKATDGIPVLIERLRSHAAGTHWYDFSIVGYRPAGPVFTHP
ncbi:MAG: hypothetical protein JNM43_19810 [Planctomycetaceae bacterium]|nr:hypothetical protein [Planctomycetaceae bacterium]